jgi:hypothetical protein
MTSLSDSNYLEDLLSIPATPETFHSWLARGLGRAVLHVQRYGIDGYREVLEHACLVSLTYDPQLEADRGPYLLTLMEAAGDVPYYAELILGKYASSEGEPRDRWQLSSLAGLLAMRCYPNAEDMLFDGANQAPFDWSAVKYATPWLLLETNRPRAIELLCRHAAEKDDAVALAGFMEQIAALDGNYQESDIEAFALPFREQYGLQDLIPRALCEIERWWAGRAARRNRQAPTYDEVTVSITEPPERWGPASYGARAGKISRADLRKLAVDFDSETDGDRLHRYLGLFGGARCPTGFRKIRSLLASSEPQFRFLAIGALGKFRHPSLNKLAFELEIDHHEDEAAELLERNYRRGDAVLLARITAGDVVENPDKICSIVRSVSTIAEHFDDPALTAALLNVYENSPSTFYRKYVADALRRFGSLPPWITQEEPFDAEVVADGAA